MYAWAWNVSFKRKKYFTESKWPCVFTNHTSILSTHTLPLPWISLGVLSLDVICLIDWLIMLEVNDPRALGSLPLSWEPETQSPVLTGGSSPDTADLKQCHFHQKTPSTKCPPFPLGFKILEKIQDILQRTNPLLFSQV